MIPRTFRLLFYGLITAVLQTSVVPGMEVLGQRPDLVVVFAVIVGAWSGASTGALAGFLTGLLVDLSHPPTLGAGATAATLAGYMGGRLQTYLDLESLANQAVALAGTAFAHTLVYGFMAAIKADVPFWITVLGRGIGGAVYTALIGMIVFRLTTTVSSGRLTLVRR